jgi:hypothetical protein
VRVPGKSGFALQPVTSLRERMPTSTGFLAERMIYMRAVTRATYKRLALQLVGQLLLPTESDQEVFRRAKTR